MEIDRAMDADVYWNDRLVGRLSHVRVDQPYYHGTWSSAHDPTFEQELRALQARLGPNGLGMLPVVFRSPDGRLAAPVRAMVRPAPETAPYFRFGFPGEAASAVIDPAPESGRPA
jgi:hypothetical protein